MTTPEEIKWRILEKGNDYFTVSFKCVLCNRWIITKIDRQKWEKEMEETV